MKIYIKRFVTFFILIFIAQILIISPKANADTTVDMPIVSEEKNILEERISETKEEKIMKIDAKTGKTTEVDIDYSEVASILTKMKNENNYSTKVIAESKVLNNNQNLLNRRTLLPMSINSSRYTIQIGNNTSMELKPICRIESDGGVGTGFLIGEKYLLTAAHCVLTPDANVFGYWSAYAGYCNGVYAQEMGWSTVHYSENWTTYGSSSSFDWAIVELDGNYGSSLGWMYCTKYYNYEDMLNIPVTAWGYPECFNAEYLCRSDGTITNTPNSWTFDSSCTVERGFSGGPTKMSDGTACGINIAMYSSDDQTGTLKSVRFNDSLFNLILDLLNN